jgi:DNA topoisomerase 2-associated protein PAT1
LYRYTTDRAAYDHDYYFQNWLSVTNRSKLREPFAPETIRELAPQAKEARAPTAFVTLDGLGRVPFSNVRAPKVGGLHSCCIQLTHSA